MYTVTFQYACPLTCSSSNTSTATHTYKVEVFGNSVNLTEPSTFAGGTCQLSGCDCAPVPSNQRLHVVFTSTGFVADGDALVDTDGGGCTQVERWVGTKQ
jgi:hypothetical protein